MSQSKQNTVALFERQRNKLTTGDIYSLKPQKQRKIEPQRVNLTLN
jgi:hypothetical protein